MKYYVNKNAQSNGDHEVHKETCRVLPYPENRLYLGEFSNCRDAVHKAKQTYTKADGCEVCSPECNTR